MVHFPGKPMSFRIRREISSEVQLGPCVRFGMLREAYENALHNEWVHFLGGSVIED